jgi:hypothetical protein
MDVAYLCARGALVGSVVGGLTAVVPVLPENPAVYPQVVVAPSGSRNERDLTRVARAIDPLRDLASWRARKCACSGSGRQRSFQLRVFLFPSLRGTRDSS